MVKIVCAPIGRITFHDKEDHRFELILAVKLMESSFVVTLGEITACKGYYAFDLRLCHCDTFGSQGVMPPHIGRSPVWQASLLLFSVWWAVLPITENAFAV
jgi:hypothetical protein